MLDKDLQEKVAYFQEQDLLEISDDEQGFPDEGYSRAEQALADSKAMPPPKLNRQSSSFLGPTPKERQKEFVHHTAKQRESIRTEASNSIDSVIVSDPKITDSMSNAKSRDMASPSSKNNARNKHKRTFSMPNLSDRTEIPFYKRMGVVPRELKSGRNVKPAENIKLEAEDKQLLKGKVIYFFPNDDVSMARRLRIHKVIQLGAAWVKTWRDDVTHVMADDASYTYSQLLRHLNKAGLPRKILVKFDPYIPQCIQFGTLLDPSAGRFLMKGAPQPSDHTTATQISSPATSQTSLQIKQSRRQVEAEGSPRTGSVPTEGSIQSALQQEPTITSDEVIKDSFVYPSSSPREEAVDSTEDYDDALTEAINQTRAVAHLPLDDDEEGDSRPSSSAGQEQDSGSDAEEPEPDRTRAVPKGKGNMNQHAFQCMDPTGTSSRGNPNASTVEVLEQMGKYYDQMQDQWRTLAYRKAITTLRKQNTKITTAKEAAALPFIGSRLADKIEEIVWTDRLRRLDSTRDDPTDKVLRLFLGVYGAGLSQANKWIQAGHRTLDDLRTNAKLTESQKIGINHYNDFGSRIPRAEVKAHGDFVRSALYKIDAGFQVTIMGSYRRGAEDSGDIDLIITKPGVSIQIMREVIFHTLVPLLSKAGFLKAKLATSSRTDDGTKWHGASCLPSSTIWRRLDLLLVPEAEMGAALIFFTGNDIFNRSMRLLASKKGMRLNQRGLYKDVIRGKNRERLTEGTLVEGEDEKKIFQILGVPWREPTERIC